MAAVGDIIKCVVTQTLLGIVANNVWHFKVQVVGTEGTASEAINEWMRLFIENHLSLIQDNDVLYTGLYSVNYHDGADFNFIDPDLQGQHSVGTGSAMPSWVCFVFRAARVAAGQRYGYKRIAGVIEEAVSGNTVTGDTGEIADIVAELNSTIGGVSLGGWQFQHYIATGAKVLGTNPAGYVPGLWSFRGINSQRSRLP